MNLILLIVYVVALIGLVLAILQYNRTTKQVKLRVSQLEEIVEIGMNLNKEKVKQVKEYSQKLNRLQTVVGSAQVDADESISKIKTELSKELSIWRNKRQNFERVINNQERSRKKSKRRNKVRS